MGNDIGATEAKRCIKELKSLIYNILQNPETDSPFFNTFLRLNHVLSEEEYNSVIKELVIKKNMFCYS